MKKEQEVIAQWKAEGILEHLFLREKKNGAVLIFNNITEEKTVELMKTLPFFQLKTNIEYYNLMKQF